MLPLGLNHMTLPRKSGRELVAMAASIGCAGIELRNDLDVPLFDNETPESFANRVNAAGLQIFALAEVTAFNVDPHEKLVDVTRLIETAARCGAAGVALIPQVSPKQITRAQQRVLLRDALTVLQPVLEDHGVIGLIEPLGFIQSTLRHKADVSGVLADIRHPACFAMIHDTFHHHLSGDTQIYPELTALLHISGVADRDISTNAMTDAHRGLVFGDDRLGNIAQLRAFAEAGFDGPASFEAFAPEIHQMTDPTATLAGSIAFMTSQLTAPAVGVAS